ncbi:MAG: T9SS type A sorting domain-containing protein [Bacteroidetes bacterium]|nr:T9SS type A sorting domain-containing protein [Bacteroidota bacterium]
MIKKLLLLPIAVFILHLSGFSQAACTPDPQYTTKGVWPDTIVNFDTAYVGTPYSQLITIIIPKDTQAFPPPFPPLSWDSTVLTGVTGLPSSMVYACWNNSSKPNRCAWPGNSTGCAKITGTPTSAEIGTYALVFNTDNYIGGNTSPNAYAITGYRIVVLPASSVNENTGIQNLLQNNPNPFGEKSEIIFTAEENGIGRFKIYNLIGTVVKEYTISVKKGTNKIELDGKDFDNGIYFYSIVNGSNAYTRKMIVKK